jgi:hypothetical protein
MENADDLKKLLDDGAEKVTTNNILFLDVSSTCTGYAVATVDFKAKTANFHSAGALWLNPKWCHQEKYCYMSNAITNYFSIVEKIDYIVVEQYSFNSKKMMGVQVVPEMIGAIKSCAWDVGVKVGSILPQSWRSTLKIKKDDKGYKIPTKDKILQYVQVPDKSVSNITRKERTTPFDLYDALGVGMAWLMRLNLKVGFNDIEFNRHISLPDEL